MTINLSAADAAQLRDILMTMPDFRTEKSRWDFIDDMLSGSGREQDIKASLDLSGNARGAAVRLINRLTQFGQDEPGQEVLTRLINTLLEYIGGGEKAEFLESLFDRYPLAGQPVATRPIDEWRGRERDNDVAEKIIGENTLRHIRMLEQGLLASKAVARIITTDSYGSGFLVGEKLLMTNHHVIATPAAAQTAEYQFHYQLGLNDSPLTPMTVHAKPDGLFFTSPREALDFTVIELDDTPADVKPLRLASLRVQKDQRVNIIQHPGGGWKKISLQNNFVAFANSQDVQYLTSTEPGSSGSPVFNDDFVVIAIHHSGGNLLEPGSNRSYLRNGGSSMVAVLKTLELKAPEIYKLVNVV
ncbi:MAG: trypsin-like peptidase domain-containing protein [Anaerolineales bacterium]|nr:trypsin-like peptidase domain-containing protein [Anaerolineales bacterium]